MKRIVMLACTCALVYTSQAQTVPDPKKDINTVVSISNADYNMGKISAGKPLEYNLVIKNISKDTVVLQDVRVGCGCTSPKFKAGEALFPGKSTFITLGFNGGANGEFTKTADIIFSGGLSKQVKFYGVAVIADSTAAPVYNN